jgi:hypothetical protein
MISLDAMPIQLGSREEFAWVSPEDWLLVNTCGWRRRISGLRVYAASHHRRCGHGRHEGDLHRFVGALMGMSGARIMDHRDGNGLNNTRQNLRSATRAQNNSNRRPNLSNRVGLKGVRRCGLRFLAQITVSKRNRYLGLFVTAEAAARVYDAWAKAAFGEFAWINYPEGINGQG